MAKSKDQLPKSGDKALQKSDSQPLMPEDFILPKVDPHQELRENVEKVLSDKFMVVLTILLVPVVLIPAFIDTTTININVLKSILQFFILCDVIIVSFFIVEYFAKLYLAENKIKHFWSPWHILDLAVILLSLAVYYEVLVSTLGILYLTSPSNWLRLARLLRVFSLGGRTVGSRVRVVQAPSEGPTEEISTKIRAVSGDLKDIQENVTWEQLGEYLTDAKQQWIDIYDLTPGDFAKLGEAFQIPEAHFESKLVEEGYSRIDYLEKLSLVFLQEGQINFAAIGNRFFTISKTGFLIICSGTDIVTVSRQKSEMFENVLDSIRKKVKDNPLVVVILHGIFDYTLKKFRSIVNSIEMELVRLESIPRTQIPSNFLEITFQMKKEVTELGSNLLHLKEILGFVVSKRVPLEGFNQTWEEMFTLFQDEAGFLQESAENAKDNLMSIIDLHINRTSYETNKILKILAVITVLGVIPSIMSGLLGENLADSPFSPYLWQVVGIVIIIIALITYIFVKLGWLKSD
ncbi:MAG TPA: CorA family divalent cation transporter [Candidatus Lokiarchaeia archaeon]|nr:CorA family divalent cation transporter [Candidatus Lokiarchaeia archaeon]